MYWRVRGVTPSIFLKLRESWSKDSHAPRKMVTAHSVTLFICDSILLLPVVGQIVKTSTLQRKVSRQISARKQCKTMGEVV